MALFGKKKGLVGLDIGSSKVVCLIARAEPGVLHVLGAALRESQGLAVAVIDVAGRQFVRSIEDVGQRPWGIGVSPDGKKLYTANGPSGDVSIVDIATGKIDRRIAVGGSPWGVVVAAKR